MRSKNPFEDLIPEEPFSGDVYQRIDRCEKTLRTIRRCVLMRVFLTALLLYIPFGADMPAGVVAMLVFVTVINASGLLPLIQQWKRKKKELDDLWEEVE